MKRFFGMTIAATLVSGSAYASLLQNGNLDSPGTHESDFSDFWTLIEPDTDSTGAPTNSATFASFADHTGAGGTGLWYRSFEGGLGGDEPFEVDAHLQQAVGGAAGVDYTLSAWYRFETNYSGLDALAPTQTILAIDFLDGGGGVISSAELDIDTVYDSVAFGWQEFSVMGTAPAGTVQVQARSSMIDGVLAAANPQSAFVDDFTLVPEPTSLLLLLPGVALLRRR